LQVIRAFSQRFFRGDTQPQGSATSYAQIVLIVRVALPAGGDGFQHLPRIVRIHVLIHYYVSADVHLNAYMVAYARRRGGKTVDGDIAFNRVSL